MNDIHWLHLDKTHASYASALTLLTTKFAATKPNNILSINENDAGTEVLIKIVSESGWIDSAPALFLKTAPFSIRVFTTTDHDEAVTLVTDGVWRVEV